LTLRYMLDTNICVYVLNGARTELANRFDANIGNLCVSSITLGELWYGVEKSAPTRRDSNVRGLVGLIGRLDVLSFDDRAAADFGKIRAALELAGTPCGGYDMQIGAHARSLDLTLVTNNRREFDRMPGLKVENWV
jgi:tRNA(fMet)-specific endonuclease VapC